MKKLIIGLLAIAALTFGISPWTDASVQIADCEADLRQAAAAAGVAIDTDHIFAISRNGATFTGAVIRGFEQVPATALPAGVDFGFAFVELPGIPAGHYILRAAANVQGVGRTDATVQFIHPESGDPVALANGFVEVDALVVPDNPRFTNTVITGGLDLANGLLSFFNYYICPNGWLICWGRPVVQIFRPNGSL